MTRIETLMSVVEAIHSRRSIRAYDPAQLDRLTIERLLDTDADIAAAVRHTLTWNVTLDEDRIRTTVADGHVTLEGEVDTWAQRRDAAAVLWRIVGVRMVVNNLVVRPSRTDPAEVQHAIEEALERRSEREARHITVEVRGGVATLSGPVYSWAERRAAVGAARQTRGVHEVRDLLHIEPAY